MSFSEQLTRRGKFNLIFLFVILPICGLGAIFVLLNLDTWLAARPAIPVTFYTIASHEGDKVSIEGNIMLYSSVAARQDSPCQSWASELRLVQWDSSMPDDLTVNVYLESTYSAEPNHFYLPDFYSDDDFKIYTDEGQELGYTDVIRVIGTVWGVWQEDGSTTVYLCPSKIEAGD